MHSVMRSRVSLVGSFAAALMLPLAYLPAAVADEPPPSAIRVSAQVPDPGDSDNDGTADRSETHEARLAARELDRRVEDLSQRTPSTQVFANADGTWTTEAHAGPVRRQDPETGTWSPIDTTLAKTGGAYRPDVAFGGMRFSDGGDEPMVTMTDVDGEELSWSWPSPLPAPKVEGSTLTYAEVIPDGDLVIEALPAGFSYSVVLHAPPAGGLEFPIEVDTAGTKLVESGNGSLRIGTKRRELVTAPEPMMWGADSVGENALKRVAITTEISHDDGQVSLTLKPDSDFLSDPETVYPVTIDPTFTTSPAYGGAVSRLIVPGQTPVHDWSAMVGGSAWGPTSVETHLWFDYSGPRATNVTAATLSMYAYSSYECGPISMTVERWAEAWNPFGSAEPVVTTAGASTAVQSAKGDPCGAGGWDSWDITSIAQAWENPATYAGGLRVRTTENTIEGARNYQSNWGANTPLVTITSEEPVLSRPTISCNPSVAAPNTHGSWKSTVPSSPPTCTINAPGSGRMSPSAILWSVDGAPETRTRITPPTIPGASVSTTVQIPAVAGAHSIRARSESPMGQLSSTALFEIGFGPLTLSTPQPRASGRSSLTTTGPIAIRAQGPRTLTGVSIVRWRVAGSGANDQVGWSTAPAQDLTTSIPNPFLTFPTTIISGQIDVSTFPGLDKDRSTLLEIQVCMMTSPLVPMSCTWSTSPLTVLKVPHAFGPTNPTASAGPGTVAMLTGELMVTETDADEVGYNSELSISRTHATLGGVDGGDGIFGPGWSASLDGPGTGFSGATLFDSTPDDGTIALVDSVGGILVWTPSLPVARRTAVNLHAGEWAPVDEDTRLSGIKLHVSVHGAVTKATITDIDGTKTVFTAATPSTISEFDFVAEAVQEAGQSAKTTYSANSLGQVTRILSPVPAGVTCPASGALVAGCRALALSYGTSGSNNRRLTAVHWVNGAASTPVASYTYDATGRLSAVTDARTGLVTSYAYDGTSGRLASMTPPGLKTFRFTYDSDGRLVDALRDKPAGAGTSLLTTVRYDIPRDGSAGLPDLTAEGIGAWNQQIAPTYGAAAFDSRAPSIPASVGDITAEHWQWASLSYADERGRATNTGEYGSSRWLLTATDYDQQDNAIRELDTGDIAAIQDGRLTASNAGTLSTYAAVRNALDQVTIPAGAVLTETFGTAREAVVDTDGGKAWVRPHTTISYDQGAPNNGINPSTGTGYSLQTRSITRAWDVASEVDLTAAGSFESEVRTGYDPIATGDTSGWALARSTTTITEMGGSATDLVASTRYDAEGRVIETRQPKSGGADAGTRRTVYYTAGTNTDEPSCGSKPAWAGQACVIRYAGASSTGALPATKTTAYDANLQPLTIEESVAGALRRTTNTTYDYAGRPAKTWTAASGVTGSTFANGQATTYSSTTGLSTDTRGVTSTGALTGDPVTVGHDAWGRQTSYAPAPGESTTTTYDGKGQVATVTDPRGTTTYRYDGATGAGAADDADGKTERRGLVTAVATSRPGAADVTFSGAYDANGALVTQKLPGGLTQRNTFNVAGDLTTLTYSGPVTNSTNTDPDASWLKWAQETDVLGRTVNEWTPEGAAFRSELSSGSAAGYARTYAYDRASRLTQVTDRGAPAGAGPVSWHAGSLTLPAGTTCQTRNYAFDDNGNRTSLTRRGANTNGTCATAVAATKNWAYDAADRYDSGSGYAYDILGRVTTLPAGDSPAGSTAGNATLGYYDDDTIRTITQDGMTSTYALDVDGRRASEATGPTGGWHTSTVVSHFTDASDNPTWVQKATGATTTTSRYLDSLGGDLTATLTSTGTAATETASLSLALANPHGDIVTAVNIPATGNATGITEWNSYDEYGTPLTGAVGNAPLKSDTGIGYGWVGNKQRAATGSGLILMGARVYNAVSGSFTSTDPVFGGNSTAYGYPQDPVNSFDLDGEWGKPKWLTWKNAAKVGAVAAFGTCVAASAGACAAAGVAAAAVSARSSAGTFKSKSFATSFAANTGYALAGAGVGKGISSAYKSARSQPSVYRPSYLNRSTSSGAGKHKYSPGGSHYVVQAKVGAATTYGSSKIEKRRTRKK